MLKDTGILITGGYKIMGRRVAADLAPDYSDRVVVAAWSAEEAAQLAVELGHGVRERRVEVGDYKTYWPGCVIESACVGP
jgi:NAD(P)-dependent dehydrogenase (short-subunit alcohol dehydrogenase family)